MSMVTYDDSHPMKTVRMDDKGRVNLSNIAKEGIRSYKVYSDAENRIILDPYMAEIPARELWVFENKAALADIDEGFGQYKSGKLKKLDDNFLADDE